MVEVTDPDEPAEQVVGGGAGALEESAEELYESAPCGYLSTRMDGTIVRINRTLLDWLGHDRDELLDRRTFQSLLTVGGRIYYETHFRPLLAMQGSVREIAVELRRRDGSRLPALVNSVVRADDSGTPSVIRTTVFEATSRRTYEQELLAARRAAERSEQRLTVLHRLVSQLAAALTPADIGGVLVGPARQAVHSVASMLWLLVADGSTLVRVSAVSPAVEPLLLRTPLDAAMPHTEAFRRNEVVLLDSVEAARRAYPLFASMMAAAARDAVLFVPLAVRERVLGVVAFSFDRSHGVSDDDLELLRTAGRQAGQALERARLQAETTERRRQAEFLAALSRDLEGAPGRRQRAERLVASLVPEIARWARVELLAGHALVPLATTGAAEPGGSAAPDEPVAHIAAALAHGIPRLAAAGADGIAEAALPLRAGRRVVGVLVLGLAGAGDTYGLADFLAELAESAGLALENGRLYDQERENAHALQRGLLAGEPPRDPRATVTTFYRPAGEDLEVGGDWYDAFPVGPDKMALVVGDVVGRGIRAASVMGQLRSAIRALAATGLTPAVLLERLDRFVDRFDAGRVSTVAYGELDLSTGRLRYACAGHLPPLLVEPDGSRRFLWGGRSGPLAAFAGVKNRTEDEVEMQPGSRLLLYTDGLIERRDSELRDEMDRLADEVARRHRAPLSDLLPDLVTSLADRRHGDDVCLLCVSFGATPRFAREVDADVARLKGLRDDFRTWLNAIPMSDDEHTALLLVCSEAVANAIEHGYRSGKPGVVSVRAELTDGMLELTVRDHGSWRSPDPESDRGRGLSLMRTLMDRVLVEHGAGTVVTMRRQIGSETAA